MPDHLIRLRKGWKSFDLDAPHADPRQVALPLRLDAQPAQRLRLIRRFGSPPLDSLAESLWLRLESVKGLEKLEINGVEMAVQPDPRGVIEIRLTKPLERNELALELALADSGTPDGSRCWGEIALIVRPVLAGTPQVLA